MLKIDGQIGIKNMPVRVESRVACARYARILPVDRFWLKPHYL